ncbi:MAG: 3-dehydroquinate synthase [Psittacicella sp.]
MNYPLISVDIKEYKSYNIHISLDIDFHKSILSLSVNQKILIVTSKRVSELHLKYILDKLAFVGITPDIYILEDGENYKTLETSTQILSYLIEHKYDTKSILVSLGGGVISDLTGYVASIYKRGIKYINIPTTLLAQVDASIGGKTGVNFKSYKNMIGSIYQPSEVLISSYFLQTLPLREFLSGMAEVIKYACTFSKKFFNWLETNSQSILDLDKNKILELLYFCAQTKVDIISKDPNDNLGIRAVLNFGHTLGHAIESFNNYKYLHGECVSIGILLALKISSLVNNFNTDKIEHIKNLFLKFGIALNLKTHMKVEDYIEKIIQDKKSVNNSINFILLKDIGNFEINPIDITNISSILTQIL